MYVVVQIDPMITLMVFIPLVLIVGVVNLALDRIRRYREASRDATGRVAGFIGEMFEAAQAIKVANAESRMLKRFDHLNDKRSLTTLKDLVFNTRDVGRTIARYKQAGVSRERP